MARTIIIYNNSEEIRVFSNKKKAHQAAILHGYSKSYNHFSTMLKDGFGVDFYSINAKSERDYHNFKQHKIE
ncbi:MAG: hypothetical protein MUF45_10025 [Spirosomaceae bacterium]|jgi:hypothetical protein|nr:hypothetical protein [Spirosomataceae bacterium]